MGKIAIVTDSNSGIVQAEAKELGVYVIPMPFMIDGKDYLEEINLTILSEVNRGSRDFYFHAITGQCDGFMG